MHSMSHCAESLGRGSSITPVTWTGSGTYNPIQPFNQCTLHDRRSSSSRTPLEAGQSGRSCLHNAGNIGFWRRRLRPSCNLLPNGLPLLLHLFPCQLCMQPHNSRCARCWCPDRSNMTVNGPTRIRLCVRYAVSFFSACSGVPWRASKTRACVMSLIVVNGECGLTGTKDPQHSWRSGLHPLQNVT